MVIELDFLIHNKFLKLSKVSKVINCYVLFAEYYNSLLLYTTANIIA